MDGIDEQLRRIYGDRRWIIAVGAAAAAIRTDATLKDWGCETLVVAALDGVGDLPDAPIVRTNATA
ncbi:MAG: hypothetical protein KDB69_01545, partial [Acidimicrobiia bacterium]|nr:hypothetical protein [Acidimicrobiia bacterium]